MPLEPLDPNLSQSVPASPAAATDVATPSAVDDGHRIAHERRSTMGGLIDELRAGLEAQALRHLHEAGNSPVRWIDGAHHHVPVQAGVVEVAGKPWPLSWDPGRKAYVVSTLDDMGLYGGLAGGGPHMAADIAVARDVGRRFPGHAAQLRRASPSAGCGRLRRARHAAPGPDPAAHVASE